MQRTEATTPPEARVTHASDQAESRDHAAHSHSHSSPLRAVAIGAAALVVLFLALIFGYNAAHADRAYRGMHVLEQDLGGMTRAEAVTSLEKASAGYPTDSVTLSDGSKTWLFSAADLGVKVDVNKTVDAAMKMGRAGGLDDLGTQAGALFGGASVTPVLAYDTALLDKAIAQVASEVDRPAIDSKLEQGTDGKVQITPSSAGSVVDREAMHNALASSVAAVPFAPVSVTMRTAAPKITEVALEATRTQAMLLTDQPLNIKSDERNWTIEPSELRKMLSLSPSEAGGWTVSLDNNALAEYLVPVADKLRIAPQDATVVVGKGVVTLKEDKEGAELQVPEAIAAIRDAATKSDVSQRAVELPVKVVSAEVHTDQVRSLYEKANSLVTQGMRLHFRDDGYILRGTSVTGFIDIAPSQGGAGPLKLMLDEDVLSSRISGVAYNINRPTSDARFRMLNGAPTKTASGQAGYKVDVAKSLQNAKQAIEGYTGGDRLQVDLAVAVTEPNLKDADVSNINTPDLLGTGQTSYAGSSAERAWNVGLGARKVDGALIPPGGVFSTVNTIGDLTLDAGFKMGYMIINTGKGVTTVPAEAGGICQVATTLFHSVFWSGLQIEERNWHSYWISSYGRAPSGLQGLDATIAPPEKDFRFRNTTSNWILVKANADGKNLTFSLYGVKPNWTVSVGKPVITNVVKTDNAPITEYSDQLPQGKKVLVEHAQDGFNASISRVVTDAGGNVVDKWTAKSRYVPAHERYLIGTGK